MGIQSDYHSGLHFVVACIAEQVEACRKNKLDDKAITKKTSASLDAVRIVVATGDCGCRNSKTVHSGGRIRRPAQRLFPQFNQRKELERQSSSTEGR